MFKKKNNETKFLDHYNKNINEHKPNHINSKIMNTDFEDEVNFKVLI